MQVFVFREAERIFFPVFLAKCITSRPIAREMAERVAFAALVTKSAFTEACYVRIKAPFDRTPAAQPPAVHAIVGRGLMIEAGDEDPERPDSVVHARPCLQEQFQAGCKPRACALGQVGLNNRFRADSTLQKGCS